MNEMPLEYKMNEMVNRFLLAGDKFMPEMHLKQPGFTFNTCGPFTTNRERMQKVKETGDTKYIYRNELDKACFQHYMAHRYFKDLVRRAASYKVLKDIEFNIAKNPKCEGYQRGLTGSGLNTYANNEKPARELHKPITGKF